MNQTERFAGCLLGLAVGDAVGTTLEFKPRGSFEPITDMVGGGSFHLNAGEWTDDTSMALCLGHSLVERGEFDAIDQMKRYVLWMRDGYMSSNGVCFDIGSTTRTALENFEQTGEPFSGSTDPLTAGNGSLMRLAPVPMFYFPDLDTAVHYAAESSKTTHAAPECVDACRYFASLLIATLRGDSKEEILTRPLFTPQTPKIKDIADGSFRTKYYDEIRGTGYVVDSLEAALYCFDSTSSYEEAILRAANLGDDADTTAAICGQLAGAFYGKEEIPGPWLAKCVMAEEIEALAMRLMNGD